MLALVMLSSIPLLVIAGGTMALIISKMASRGQTAYAKAANVVEQTISSIRTVHFHFSLNHSHRISDVMGPFAMEIHLSTVLI